MAVQPSEKITWAVNDVNDPLTGAPNKEEPTTEFKNEGLKREEPLLRGHLNWALNNIGKWIEYLDTVNSTISEDTTIYVSTLGDDVTGDGTQLAPFATPQKALESLIGVPIATEALVTIFCFAGTYVMNSPVIINHPYGERIHIIGEDLVGNKPFGVPTTDWSSDRNNPTTSPRAADEYYNTAGSLAANANYATRLAALQSDLNNNKVLIKSRFGTVFEFTSSSGIQVQGNNCLGKIDKIAIIGDWAGNDADVEEYYGIDSGESITGIVGTPTNVSGGTIFVGGETVVIGFRGDGIRARYGGVVACEEGVVSAHNLEKGFNSSFFSCIVANKSLALGNIDHGYLSISTSMIRAEGSVSTGNIGNGAQSSTGSSIRSKSSRYLGNGKTGLTLSIGSFGSVDFVIARGNNLDGLRVNIGSGCDMDTCILSDNNVNGIKITGGTVEGVALTISNNGGRGIEAINGARLNIESGTIELNVQEEVFAQTGVSIALNTTTIPAGSEVTALNNSYISSPNTAGVSFSPAWSVVGNNESLINN